MAGVGRLRAACADGWLKGEHVRALKAHTVEVMPDGTAAEHYQVPGQTLVCPGSGQPVREAFWVRKETPDDVVTLP
jgi:hypothetical protein